MPILMCGLVLAACGTTSDTGIPTANGSSSASASASAGSGDLTAFAACVREHGVNVADPNPGTAAEAWMRQQAEQNPAFDAAVTPCARLLPGGGGVQQPTAQELEQLRAFAVCMRTHDIEMSDPTPTGNMRVGGRLEHVTRAQVENDPGYKAAYAACKDKLPAEGDSK